MLSVVKSKWHLTQALLFVPEVYVDRATELLFPLYSRYVQDTHFLQCGEIIPTALSIFLHDVESYGDHGRMADFMRECVAYRLHELDDRSFPDPESQEWTDDHELTVCSVLSEMWETHQSEMLHDMTVLYQFHGLSLYDPDTKHVINDPIVEVW